MRQRQVSQRAALSRTAAHFHYVTRRSERDEAYWRQKIFGNVIRKETDLWGNIVNIREWSAPNDWMEAIVTRALYDAKSRRMGRFQKALIKNMTALFMRGIQDCAYKGSKDFVVDGPKGVSKSTIIMWIFLRLKEAMEAVGKTLHGPILVWSIKQALAAYKNCEDCSFVDMDEDHAITGKGKNITKDNWSSTLESIRIRQVSTAIASPEQRNMPGCETKLTPIAIWTAGLDRMRASNDEDTSECWCKVLVSTRDHSAEGMVYKPAGHIIMFVGDAIAFMKEINYEERKRADQVNLNEMLGNTDSFTEDDRIEAHDIEERIVTALHNANPPWDGLGKSRVKTVAFDNGINLPAKLQDFILDFVWSRRFEFQKTPQKAAVGPVLPAPMVKVPRASGPFNTTREDIEKMLDMIAAREDKPNNQRDVGIYREFLDQSKQAGLDVKFGLDHSSITRIIKSVEGAIADLTGERYEEYLEPVLQEDARYKNVIHDGKHGQVDFTCIGEENGAAFTEFVAAKAYNFRGKDSCSFAYKKIKPELLATRAAIQQGIDARCVVVVKSTDSGNAYKYIMPQDDVLNWDAEKDSQGRPKKKYFKINGQSQDNNYA